jgi:hypothetical protein
MTRYHPAGCSPEQLARRALRQTRARNKTPVGEAYAVREDVEGVPRVYKIVVVSRSDKRITVVGSNATGSRTNFDPKVFDRRYPPTREAAVAYWRRKTQDDIEYLTREINNLRRQLAIEPKDSRR